jgi:hypothetical protein
VADTTADTLALVREAIDTLENLGSVVGDEQQYVLDLARAWRIRLDSIAGDGRSVSSHQAEAIRLAVAETAAITDPHKAIDWLSTLPQLVQAVLEGV